MSLVLIDLEMESDHSDPGITREKPTEVENTCGSHSTESGDSPRKKPKCKTDAKKTKGAVKTMDAVKTKNEKAKYTKKEASEKKPKHANKKKYSQKEKDTKHFKDVKKENNSVKTKDAKKETDAKKEKERPVEKVKQSEKWGTLRRIVHALGMRASGTSTSPHNSDDLGCDDISFDGHLFEYASHPPVIPKVDVPRLRLRPTLRERPHNIANNLFRCGLKKQHNQYTLD